MRERAITTVDGKGSGTKRRRREGGAPEGLRPVTRCNSLAKSHFEKTFVRSGRLKNCASQRMSSKRGIYMVNADCNPAERKKPTRVATETRVSSGKSDAKRYVVYERSSRRRRPPSERIRQVLHV